MSTNTEQINYEKLLPQNPVSDIVAFALQNGKFQEAYLIYRSEWMYDEQEMKKRNRVRIVCSACGAVFHAEKIPVDCCSHSYAPAPFGWRNEQTGNEIISGKKSLCPFCGAEAKSVHIGNIKSYGGELVTDALVTELYRVPVEGKADRLALMEWIVRRCVSNQGVTRYEIWPFVAYVVEEKKVVRLMGYMKNIGGRLSLFGEWKQRKKFVDVYGWASLVVPWDKSLLEGTTAENSKLDLYQGEREKMLVGYLALWRRRPAVENLLVQGCGCLVDEWISREAQSYLYRGEIPKLPQVNWKQKRPAQMLGLNKEEFRQMRRMHWDAEDLYKYRLVRDSGVPVRLSEDMELLKHFLSSDCARVLEEAPKADFWRTLRYLKKQNANWSTLRDYRNMAAQDGRDMTDNLVQWPRNLKAAHDRYVEERRARQTQENAERREREIAARRVQFEKRAVELASLYFEMDGLLIRPCADEGELIQEGHDLHHCVSSYAQRHASGETAILFVRTLAEPDQPFFTLEFDEKRLAVLQNRGMRNCARPPEIQAFEDKWLAWVRAGAPRGKDGKPVVLAAHSTRRSA